MGLLTKAAVISEEKKKEEEVPPTVENSASGAVWLDEHDFSFTREARPGDGYSLLAEIESYTSDLEFPLRLFAAIQRFFTFEKAALFFYEEAEKTFMHWVACGFDETTMHRLRIPALFIERQFPDVHSCSSAPTAKDIQELKPYFSFREFSMLERVFFHVFRHNDETPAVFMAALNTDDDGTAESIASVFCRISDTCAKKLHALRQTILSLSGEPPTALKRDLALELEVFIKEASLKNRKVSVVHIDLSKALAGMFTTLENADPLRFKQEITRIILSMMPEEASIVKTSSDKLVLLIAGRSKYDADILNLQFSQALSTFFHCAVSSMVTAGFCFPDDCEDTGDFISMNVV